MHHPLVSRAVGISASPASNGPVRTAAGQARHHGLDRRSVLRVGLGLAGAAALPACTTLNSPRMAGIDPALIRAAVPARSTLPGIQELDALCRDLAAAGMAVQRIGTSRGGRPIHLVSPPSTGRLNALVVGTPHPNEPIGGLSVITLLEMLRAGHPLMARSSFRWHVIPSIEPDGLALNDAWLNTPGDFRAYARGFYRPAFRDQAEYSFPLLTRGYRFERTTPETRAWMSVIDRLKPQLMVSLHNADLGGVFSVLSRPHPALATELAGIGAAYGIARDEEGDPYAELERLAPGVFLAEDLVTLVERTPDGWPAGNSSSGYASRHGTLTLIPEVPMWQESVVDGQRLSSEIVAGLAGTYEASIALIERARSLAGADEGADVLMNAIAEGAPTLRRLLAANAQQPVTAMPATRVNAQRRVLRMLPLRSLGMLERWCRMQAAGASGAGDAERREALDRLGRQTSALLSSQLADASLTAGMIPTPPRLGAAAQVHATLSAAAAVAD